MLRLQTVLDNYQALAARVRPGDFGPVPATSAKAHTEQLCTHTKAGPSLDRNGMPRFDRYGKPITKDHPCRNLAAPGQLHCRQHGGTAVREAARTQGVSDPYRYVRLKADIDIAIDAIERPHVLEAMHLRYRVGLSFADVAKRLGYHRQPRDLAVLMDEAFEFIQIRLDAWFHTIRLDEPCQCAEDEDFMAELEAELAVAA